MTICVLQLRAEDLSTFDQIKPGARLKGLDPGGIAEIVQVARFGADALNIVYRVDGRVGERLLYRGEETGFEFREAGRSYGFDADGGLLRLTSEAYRIRLAHLFDPYLAVTASQIASIREAVPSIERVVVYCRNEERLEAFCREHDCEPAESHREAADHDVVVTVTTSKDPVLRGEWLRPGALVCAVGANDPRRRELDNAVLERAAFVCCDSRDDSRRESGDLIEPVEQGILDWLEVHELQEVVAGEVQGRASDDDLIVFKSNGIAAWDLAAGARVVELARERGAGLEL